MKSWLKQHRGQVNLALALAGGIASTALAISGWALQKIVGQEVANASQQTQIDTLKESINRIETQTALTNQNVYNIAVRLGVPANEYKVK